MEETHPIKMEIDRLVYNWEIMKYDDKSKQIGKKILSPLISFGPNKDCIWYMTLYPNGVDTDSEDYVSLFIYLETSNQPTIEAEFSFSILNSNGDETNVCTAAHPFQPTQGVGHYKFISNSDLITNNLVVNDKLTIVCRILTDINIINTPSLVKPLQVNSNIEELSKDFQNLMDTEKLSDVTLITSKKQFRAHKLILSARSPVFSALFEHDMKEKNTNEIHIEDIDQEVLQEMLRFIYTGKVEKLEKLAYELLSASDKYGLVSLKNMCEEVLSQSLILDNASDILILADLHKANKLKDIAVNFIATHAKSIIDTPGFKYLESLHPSLVTDVFHKLALRQNS